MKIEIKREPRKRRKGLFMKLCVGLIILQAIVYTWVHLYLSHSAGVEIAPTTSVAFITFCVSELLACCFLKKSKNKEDEANG